MKLEIFNNSSSRIPREFLSQWVKNIETELFKRKLIQSKSLQLNLVFLDKVEAKKLNYKYRNKNYATDVLSFASIEEMHLGDLVICPEVIQKQSQEHGLSIREELGYMVLHGILHLLGYDHEKSKKEAKKMFDLQDGLFEHLCRKLKTVKK